MSRRLREARQVDAGTSRAVVQRHGAIGKTVEVGRYVGVIRTMIQSEKDLPQFEAVALIEEERRPGLGLVREEPENRGADKSFPLEEARRVAGAILRLDGLTGAEIEAAERVLSVDRADIRRLREIAGNHSLLTPD